MICRWLSDSSDCCQRGRQPRPAREPARRSAASRHPASRWRISAVSVSTPRKAPRRAIVGHSGSSWRVPRRAPLGGRWAARRRRAGRRSQLGQLVPEGLPREPAPGDRPRGAAERLADSATRGVAFPFGERRRHAGLGFILRLTPRSLRVPCQRFPSPSRGRPTHDSRPSWFATPSLWGSLSSRSPCPTIPALRPSNSQRFHSRSRADARITPPPRAFRAFVDVLALLADLPEVRERCIYRHLIPVGSPTSQPRHRLAILGAAGQND